MTDEEDPAQTAVEDGPPRRSLLSRLVNSLAGRLLALTIGVVLFAEALVFTPSLARFHSSWLQDRINLAQVAALALEAAPERRIAAPLEQALLDQAEVKRIALRRSDESELLLEARDDISNAGPLRVFDYTTPEATSWQRAQWAFETLFAPEGRLIRVIKEPRIETGDVIDIVLNEQPLRTAVRTYALELAGVSTLVSMIAGALVYAILIFAFVRPMRRLTRNVERFRKRPEDASRLLPGTRRRDEIGRAERAIRAMQADIQANLLQRERLAALGGAMARIAHDLRNMLATAQLVTQRIAASQDPEVRAAAPRLERAIGRAAGLAASALRYGRAEEAAPVLRAMPFGEAVREAVADALAAFPEVETVVRSGADLSVIADPDQLHRLLVNLLRNAAQAIRAAAAEDPARRQQITVHAVARGAQVLAMIEDTGGGLPLRAQERLFQPFSSKGGAGAGLGLAIARELARAQGGELSLARTGPSGTVFDLTLQAA